MAARNRRLGTWAMAAICFATAITVLPVRLPKPPRPSPGEGLAVATTVVALVFLALGLWFVWRALFADRTKR